MHGQNVQEPHEPLTLPHDHGDHKHSDNIVPLLENASQFQGIANCFRYLGDPIRVQLFWLLCHMEECVVNLATILNMSSPAISHHLKLLKESGLITSRREGKEVYYRSSETLLCRTLHQMIETIMEISCPDDKKNLDQNLSHPQHLSSLQTEQLSTIREIHDHLITHLDQHRNIDELARQYLMNPTTLKLLFKSVYGTSIAAHIREHRMEAAAKELRETNDSIALIAERVGYTSQSKFTAAFKDFYGMLPREYRKKRKLPEGSSHS